MPHRRGFLPALLLLTCYADATYVLTPAFLAAAEPEVAAPEARCAALANPSRLACSFAADACTCVDTPADSHATGARVLGEHTRAPASLTPTAERSPTA
jgi:hypothetical protein